MRYVLKGCNDYLINPVECVLSNRGVENSQLFLNLNEDVINDYSLLKNIKEATNCLIQHLEKDSVVFILVDCDADGYASSALMYNYLKRLKPEIKIQFYVHSGKEHGLSEEALKNINDDVKLVICPDSSSSDFKEHKILADKGIDVIVLDHHQCEKYSEHAIVVNNQLCDYPNKDFSGVGITYKFCKALDKRLKVNFSEEYLDLVALGNIGDMMDMRSLETRYYTLKGLKQIKNPFIKALVEKQSFSIKGEANTTSFAFYIVPLINACVRFGTQEDKANMFYAFANSNLHFDYQPKVKKKGDPKPPVIQQHIADYMARTCVNIKAKQDREKQKGVEIIEARIVEKNLLQNKVLMVNCTGILDPNLTGLVANELMHKYKRPVILLKQFTEKIYGGSGRNAERPDLKDFRKLLWDTNMFEEVAGHDNAFGIKIKKENIMKASKITNEKLKNMTFDDIHEVDFAIPAKKLTKKIIVDLNGLKNIWGQGVSEPKSAIVGLSVPTKNIMLMGAEKNTIKFTYNGVEFVKFKTTEENYEKMMVFGGGVLKLNIVGKFSVNEYNGTTTPQVIISDYDFEVDESEEAFEF
jgi:single-stranded-DNA-specific exonuclease